MGHNHGLYLAERNCLVNHKWGGVGLLLLAIAACHTRAESGPALLALPPDGCSAAIWMDDLGAWLSDLKAFAQRGLGPLAQPAWRRVKEAARGRLGMDPLDLRAWQRAGVQPQGGAVAFFEEAAKAPVLALRLAQHTTFDAALLALLRQYDGSDQHDVRRVSGRDVHVAGRPFGDASIATLAWAHMPPYVLVQAGEPDALLLALARLGAPAGSQKRGLVHQARFAAAMAHVAKTGLRLFVQGQGAPAIGGSLQINNKGIDMQLFADQKSPALVALQHPPPLAPLLQQVPPDAALLVLSHAARPEVLTMLSSFPWLGDSLRRAGAAALMQSGLDLQTQVLPLLQGALAASVSLKPQQTGGGMSLQEAMTAALVLQVANPEAFLEVLHQGQTALRQRGVEVDEKTEAGAHLFAPKGATTVGWALWKNKYIYGWGSRGAAATLLQLQNDAAGPADVWQGPAGQLQQGAAGLMVLRGAQMAPALRKLGQAGAGATIMPFIDAVAEVMARLGDVAMAFGITPEGQQLRLLQNNLP